MSLRLFVLNRCQYVVPTGEYHRWGVVSSLGPSHRGPGVKRGKGDVRDGVWSLLGPSHRGPGVSICVVRYFNMHTQRLTVKHTLTNTHSQTLTHAHTDSHMQTDRHTHKHTYTNACTHTHTCSLADSDEDRYIRGRVFVPSGAQSVRRLRNLLRVEEVRGKVARDRRVLQMGEYAGWSEEEGVIG